MTSSCGAALCPAGQIDELEAHWSAEAEGALDNQTGPSRLMTGKKAAPFHYPNGREVSRRLVSAPEPVLYAVSPLSAVNQQWAADRWSVDRLAAAAG
jgi:hypothetical protein